MHQWILVLAGALLLVSCTRHSLAQPLCGNEQDLYTNKLCLTVLEELIRRSQHPHHIEQPLDYPAELYENMPYENRGSKRQDVDHVFLRFGR